VGITAYCVHPKHWLQEKTIIGGTKDLQLERIRALKPDLILGNHEENVKAQIEALQSDFNVHISQIECVEDAFDMILTVGKLTNTSSKAQQLVEEIKTLRAKLTTPVTKKRVAYFIWQEPMMLAGPNTFIGKMLEEVGFENAAPQNEQRYPQIAFDAIDRLNADVLLLSSEPYAFTTKDLHHLGKKHPRALCKIVDGELFSWYGSRMKQAYSYLLKFQAEMRLH
jgi:ABC-type Fe3+-hydroxamate transport system substrate-binding protein